MALHDSEAPGVVSVEGFLFALESHRRRSPKTLAIVVDFLMSPGYDKLEIAARDGRLAVVYRTVCTKDDGASEGESKRH